jgi:Bardet-Biedl syndrome 1 protein
MAAEAPKPKGGITWLNAWEDPVANLPIASQRMCLADVTGSGEVDLLAVDNANRIRVYRGTNLVSETLLLGAPSAITPIYLDEKQPVVPAVAVAIGPTLYIYKKLRPFRKYVEWLDVSSCVENK